MALRCSATHASGKRERADRLETLKEQCASLDGTGDNHTNPTKFAKWCWTKYFPPLINTLQSFRSPADIEAFAGQHAKLFDDGCRVQKTLEIQRENYADRWSLLEVQQVSEDSDKEAVNVKDPCAQYKTWWKCVGTDGKGRHGGVAGFFQDVCVWIEGINLQSGERRPITQDVDPDDDDGFISRGHCVSEDRQEQAETSMQLYLELNLWEKKVVHHSIELMRKCERMLNVLDQGCANSIYNARVGANKLPLATIRDWFFSPSTRAKRLGERPLDKDAYIDIVRYSLDDKGVFSLKVEALLPGIREYAQLE